MIMPNSCRPRKYRYFGSIKLPARGWGPFRYDWYSICSRHQNYDTDCTLCQKGGWVNHWGQFIGHIFFKLCPNLWKRLANRKH
jgi:hypothetical protein